jgi:hypothetical protein
MLAQHHKIRGNFVFGRILGENEARGRKHKRTKEKAVNAFSGHEAF